MAELTRKIAEDICNGNGFEKVSEYNDGDYVTQVLEKTIVKEELTYDPDSGPGDDGYEYIARKIVSTPKNGRDEPIITFEIIGYDCGVFGTDTGRFWIDEDWCGSGEAHLCFGRPDEHTVEEDFLIEEDVE